MTDLVHLRMKGMAKSFLGTVAVADGTLEAHGGQAVALMGANGAGKSTLMNILGGVLMPDSGTITIDGDDVRIESPRDAAAHGIAFVHQELLMFPTMSVAENIFMTELPTTRGWVNRAEMSSQSRKLLDRLGCRIDPDIAVEHLSIGDRQLIEIARALRQRARIVILDEPTSSLSSRERERLFAVVEQLKSDGVAVIYITHFLDEIFEVCEHVAVMRNGTTVHASPIADVSAGDVVELMLGATEAGERLREAAPEQGEMLLSVNRLDRKPVLNDISFDIRRGEIVGLWGLLGSGRTELVRALVGLDPVDSGELTLHDGGRSRPITPSELHRRTGVVSEDRRGEGLHLPLSVEQNVALPNLRSLLNRFGLVSGGKSARLAETFIERLNIKVAGRHQLVGTLSGGNQQKVVVSKWIADEPDLFILDEPNRGLDVKAKSDILRVIVDLTRQGKSCLVISSEVEELRRVCDRYLVISRGRLIDELPGDASGRRLLDAVSSTEQEAA